MKRGRMLWACGIGAGCIVIVTAWELRTDRSPPSPAPSTLSAGFQPDPNSCMQLLRQAVVDAKNELKRGGMGHIGQLYGGIERAKRRYPVEYARHQLVCCGKAMRTPLTDIALSPDCDPALRIEAVFALARLDGAACLDVARRLYREGRLSVVEFAGVAPLSLPACLTTAERVRHGSSLAADDARLKALLENTSGRSYEDWLLESMDCIMTDRETPDGLDSRGWDDRVRRWLNRVCDQDIDEWLARVAPAALQYRNRELGKGYDPIVVFQDFAGPYPTMFNEEPIGKVIPEEDWAVARELMEATCVLHSPTFPPRTPGWEDRLRTWYRENRPHLKYDPDKLRLVVTP